MAWWTLTPIIFWCACIFAFGLMCGSFLNVLIARLPFEKSIVWPSSRCFSCFKPVRLTDNIPILGYFRLRGKCRYCGTPFSSRYLWVELGTGIGFLALFLIEVVFNRYQIPALNFDPRLMAYPPLPGLALWAYHSFLLGALIAAAAIDAEHRFIPPLIPYTGVAVGIIGGAFLPWPWPNPAAAGAIDVPGLLPGQPWFLQEYWGMIPLGVQPWPFWGPTFAFAPPGSIQLGLLNGVIGALAGSLVVRVIRSLFGAGFGREALGMGDADLLMMAGAFLGWQIAALSLFVGAIAALVLKVLAMILIPTAPPAAGQPAPDARELPFGPGLAIGIVTTWLSWPWLGPRVQFVLFDWVPLGLSAFILCAGLLAAGLLLRRPEEQPAEAKV